MRAGSSRIATPAPGAGPRRRRERRRGAVHGARAAPRAEPRRAAASSIHGRAASGVLVPGNSRAPAVEGPSAVRCLALARSRAMRDGDTRGRAPVLVLRPGVVRRCSSSGDGHTSRCRGQARTSPRCARASWRSRTPPPARWSGERLSTRTGRSRSLRSEQWLIGSWARAFCSHSFNSSSRSRPPPRWSPGSRGGPDGPRT